VERVLENLKGLQGTKKPAQRQVLLEI